MEDPSLIFDTISGLSYTGVFLAAFVSNAIMPVPEEIIVLGIGYFGSAGIYKVILAAPLTIAGLFLSDIMVFALARTGSRFLKPWRRWLEKMNLMDENSFARRHVKKIIFLSRFIIQFRFIGPVFSGTIHVPWKTFIIYDLLALVIYVPFMFFIADYFHSRISRVVEGVGIVQNIILIGVGVFVVALFIIWLRKRFYQQTLHVVKKSGFIKTWIPGLSKKANNSRKKDE